MSDENEITQLTAKVAVLETIIFEKVVHRDEHFTGNDESERATVEGLYRGLLLSRFAGDNPVDEAARAYVNAMCDGLLKRRGLVPKAA